MCCAPARAPGAALTGDRRNFEEALAACARGLQQLRLYRVPLLGRPAGVYPIERCEPTTDNRPQTTEITSDALARQAVFLAISSPRPFSCGRAMAEAGIWTASSASSCTARSWCQWCAAG